MRKQQINIQLPKELIETLDNVKANFGSSRNFIIQKALELYFDKNIEIVEKSKKKT